MYAHKQRGSYFCCSNPRAGRGVSRQYLRKHPREENRLEHHRPLTDAIKLPPKAQYFWPLQRDCQYELLAKITPSKNILVIDPFNYYQRSKHLPNFFLSQKKWPKPVKTMGSVYTKTIWIKARRLSEDKRCTDNDKKKKNCLLITCYLEETGEK